MDTNTVERIATQILLMAEKPEDVRASLAAAETFICANICSERPMVAPLLKAVWERVHDGLPYMTHDRIAVAKESVKRLDAAIAWWEGQAPNGASFKEGNFR